MEKKGSLVKIETICRSCSGTGIFRSFLEENGVGIVCRDCNGDGKNILEYVPFTGRRRRSDIDVVYAERLILFSDRENLHPISYDAFFNGEKPINHHQ